METEPRSSCMLLMHSTSKPCPSHGSISLINFIKEGLAIIFSNILFLVLSLLPLGFNYTHISNLKMLYNSRMLHSAFAFHCLASCLSLLHTNSTELSLSSLILPSARSSLSFIQPHKFVSYDGFYFWTFYLVLIIPFFAF